MMRRLRTSAYGAILLAIGIVTMAWGEPPIYREHLDLSYVLDDEGKPQPIETAEDWAIRRGHIVASLERVLGPLPHPEKKVSLEVEVLSEQRVGPLIRRKLAYHTDDAQTRVTAWLLIPATAFERQKKLPAMLCLHQTTRIGKDEAAGLGGSANLQYGLHLAERGYVTLSPDYPSLGEYEYDFAPEKGYASGSMKAVWDNIRAVDLLSGLSFVDADRIGCVGHSLGGHNALFTAVFEPRLKVVVSSCGFSRFHKDDVPSWTGKRYMPRIASEFGNDADKVPFDFTEIVAAIAPRAFFASAATRDSDFDVTGVKDVMDAARPVYKLLGDSDRLAAYYPESAHDFPEDARRKAYEFVDRFLKP